MTELTRDVRRDAGVAARWRATFTLAVWFMVAAAMVSAPALAQPRVVNCRLCHAEQASQLERSVHREAVRCQECHGGPSVYELTAEQRPRFFVGATTQPADSRPSGFDHGESFRGKPTRAQVPETCGTCHSDVERMNPYGLQTDQLSSYWVSQHGKQLKRSGDEKVAVCIDCHGSHDVLKADDPFSRTYFKNVPATCGRCHSNAELMGPYDISATVVEEYRESVHGRNVLEAGDAGSPNCATCHGSHAAAPPGFVEVGHVCGRCHKQIEDYFLESVHGPVPVMARCVGCHGGNGDRKNHHIVEATPPVEQLLETYVAARQESDDSDTLRARFIEATNEQSGPMRFDKICANCHSPGRRAAHSEFFESNDKAARQQGSEMAAEMRDVQFEYARVAERVARVARGVLLAQDEAMKVEDAKTELMAFYAFVHTLKRAEIRTRAEKIKGICSGVRQSLDSKQARLGWRRTALWPIWIFIAVFVVFMYRKYKLLKYAWVRTTEHGVKPVDQPVSAGRRMFDIALGGFGLTAVAGLLWPAISYVLPARKRGGSAERVSAGKESDWSVGHARKVSVRGKVVIVIRSDKGFRAFSAVCTHLGCIVHWEGGKRHFACPCHAGVFDADGQVLAGPPPKPLPEYGLAVVQGEVIIKGLLQS